MKLKIKNIDIQALVNTLNKLKKMEDFIFLKINKDTLKSSTFLKSKSAVKIFSSPIAEIFEFEETDFPEFKLSLYDCTQVLTKLAYFKSKKEAADENSTKVKKVTGEIELVNVENSGNYFAKSIKIKSDKLTITIACADPSMAFQDMTDDQIARAANIDPFMSLSLSTESVNQIKELFKLDPIAIYTSMRFNKDGVYLLGVNDKCFEAQIFENTIPNEENIIVTKKLFDLLDNENYNASFSNTKIVLTSQVTDTTLILICSTEYKD